VNNAETLANVPWIVEHGRAQFKSLGVSGSRGTKVVSLNSLFRRPGLYEVEFGIPVRRIVEELGGGLASGTLRGLMIGGPLAGVIPPQLLDTPLGFDELRAIGASVGHGGVIAFDEQTSIPELVRHVFSFGAYESCGKCTPCRLGAARISDMFTQIAEGNRAAVWDRVEWQEIVTALKLASLCGLGTGLAEFAESILRYYSEDLRPCFA
jgi:formate dehydrogenase iron-sulfur subunit